jgi:hypothetical protein
MELMYRLNSIHGIQIPKDSISTRPRILLVDLKDPAVMGKLLEVFDWVAASLQEENPKNP